MRVTWPQPRPFSRFFLTDFGVISTMRLRTIFAVSICTCFGDTLGCTPKFMGSRYIDNAPFLHDDMSLRLFSIAWQEITKLKKINYTIRVYFTPLPGGPCWADCFKFLRVGWRPRRNRTYQISSWSRRGLRSYGSPKSGFSVSFSNCSYNS